MKIVKDPIAYLCSRTSGLSEEVQAKQRELLKQWVDGGKYKRKKFLLENPGSPCLHWLLKGRRCTKQECRYRIQGWLDHFEYWVDENKKPYAVVGHPYGLNKHEAQEMIEECDALGLHVYVDAASWYYPGSTLLVVVQARVV